MMTQNTDPGSRDKTIDILLFQYDMLRQEQLTTMTASQTVAALAVGSFIAALGLIQQTAALSLYPFLPPTIIVFMLVFLNQQWSVFYIGSYLGIIEEQVNALCGQSILQWHSSFAGRAIQGVAFLRHPLTHRRVVNYYPFTTAGILCAIVAVFAASVWLGAPIIGKIRPGSQVLPAVWTATNAFVAIGLAAARLWAFPKFLNAAEARFRAALGALLERNDGDAGSQ